MTQDQWTPSVHQAGLALRPPPEPLVEGRQASGAVSGATFLSSQPLESFPPQTGAPARSGNPSGPRQHPKEFCTHFLLFFPKLHAYYFW